MQKKEKFEDIVNDIELGQWDEVNISGLGSFCLWMLPLLFFGQFVSTIGFSSFIIVSLMTSFSLFSYIRYIKFYKRMRTDETYTQTWKRLKAEKLLKLKLLKQKDNVDLSDDEKKEFDDIVNKFNNKK